MSHGESVCCRARWGPVAITMSLALLCCSLMPPPAAAAGCRPIPSLTLSLDDGVKEVNVTGPDPLAWFNGSAAIGALPVERIVIQFNIKVDAGWDAEIVPNKMVFVSTAPQKFNVTVRVPTAASSSSETIVNIEGDGFAGQYHLQNKIQGIIKVQPFERICIETARPYRELDSSGGVKFEFGVMNRGNTNISFDLKPSNRGPMEDSSWEVRLSSRTGRIPEGERANYSVEARLPKGKFDTTSGMTAINISITSQNSTGPEPEEMGFIRFYVITKAYWTPILEPILIVLILGVVAAGLAVMKAKGKRLRPGRSDGAP